MSRTNDSLQIIVDSILNEVRGVSKEVTDKMIEENQIITSKLASILLRKLKLRNSAKSDESKEIERAFEAAVMRTWKKPLDLSDLLLHTSLEIASASNSRFINDAPSKHSYTEAALTSQQTKACLVFNEIIHLLKSGFPSGAYSQWKVLHEITCTSYFISKHGEKIARRYLDYEAVENFFQAQLMNNNHQEIYRKSLSEKDFNESKKKFDRMRKRYGEDFVKKSNYPYGWVPRTILKTRSSKAIERDVRLDMLRPYYNLAGYIGYGGAKGLMFKPRISDIRSKRVVLPVGPVNYGLAEPGAIAAISMGQVTSCLLLSKSSVKRVIIVETMRDLVDEICDAFYEIQTDFREFCANGKNSK